MRREHLIRLRAAHFVGLIRRGKRRIRHDHQLPGFFTLVAITTQRRVRRGITVLRLTYRRFTFAAEDKCLINCPTV